MSADRVDGIPTAKLLLTILPWVFAASLAQATDPTQGAGTLLQQVQPSAPPAPAPAATGLTVERNAGAPLPPGTPFAVNTLRLSGNTLFDTATLYALVADAVGRSLTLSQLYERVARITDYYHDHGYPLARAIIPAQVIRNGNVAIEIIEAHYGRVALDNHSRVSGALLEKTLAPLQSGQVVAQADLDHSLLLLADVPGVVVNATLKPGAAVGTSDLWVRAERGPAVAGNLVLDDYGTRYTGRQRAGGTLNLINPLRHGDVLSARALSSGRGLSYGQVSYDMLLNGLGTRVGGACSALRYELDGSLSALDAHGTARVETLLVRQPFLRSRTRNLYGQLQYDRLQLRDHIDSNAIRTDRHVRDWAATLSGDLRDSLLAGAVSTGSVAWSGGQVGFDDPTARAVDAATTATRGSFSKWSVSLSRLQGLGANDALYVAVSGQWADGNLDASQKVTAGGPYSVRAYDVGAVSGDTGYLGTLELRHNFRVDWYGHWQAALFIDSSHITVNKTAWTQDDNSATLSGAGVGLAWSGPASWRARAFIAAPLGATPALVEHTSSVRVWAEIGLQF